MATHYARALHQAGFSIAQILSPHISHAARLADEVGASPINTYNDLRKDADLYIFAITDNALYSLADNVDLHGSVVLHTSGSTPISVLSRVSQRCGVMWSPQTFVRTVDIDYASLPLCIEASDADTQEILCTLARLISPHIYTLSGEQRQWAHLASVIVSNFGNAINAIAQGVADSHGIDFRMLLPLLEATASKVDNGPLWPQQTGPAVRHDTRTLDLHRQMLSDQPQLLSLYNLLTEIIQQQ